MLSKWFEKLRIRGRSYSLPANVTGVQITSMVDFGGIITDEVGKCIRVGATGEAVGKSGFGVKAAPAITPGGSDKTRSFTGGG